MPTATQLATRAAKRIGVLDPYESLTAEEGADIEDIVNAVYESMKERGHIDFTLANMPTRYQDAFVNIIGARTAGQFGVDSPLIQQLGIAGEREFYALNERRIDPRSNPPRDY